MACFLVPVSEAIVTTIAEKVMKSKEKEKTVSFSFSDGSVAVATKISFATKLSWLNKMLWGGSALLAFEHFWHGEIVPSFPFLTVVENGRIADMLTEMESNGVVMVLSVTFVWFAMLAVSSALEKRALNRLKPSKVEA